LTWRGGDLASSNVVNEGMNGYNTPHINKQKQWNLTEKPFKVNKNKHKKKAACQFICLVSNVRYTTLFTAMTYFHTLVLRIVDSSPVEVSLNEIYRNFRPFDDASPYYLSLTGGPDVILG
jgi:hypothetical protein